MAGRETTPGPLTYTMRLAYQGDEPKMDTVGVAFYSNQVTGFSDEESATRAAFWLTLSGRRKVMFRKLIASTSVLCCCNFDVDQRQHAGSLWFCA